MFTRIEALEYRCLRSVKQSLNAFEVLIGSNASGKSTFLDVISFLGTMVSKGLEAAVEERTSNFHDLVWGRSGDSFRLAVEAVIPLERRVAVPVHGKVDTIRYEIDTRLDSVSGRVGIVAEIVTVFCSHAGRASGIEVLRRSTRSTAIQFVAETELHHYEEYGTQRYVHDRDPGYSGLSVLPADTEFPAASWLREKLRYDVKPIVLDVEALRRPRPPAQAEITERGGSYLAKSVAQLKSRQPGHFMSWLAHIRTVLPDVKDIRTEVREEDRHRYIMIHYQDGVAVPSWMVSDGTLRLLALTVLPYLPDFHGVYLVEEPENGVHPTALQAIFESLSAVDEAQVLVATHSPLLLSMATPEQLLCFTKTPEGTAIVRGSEHQALRDWRGEVSLGMLAASGILG